ncbi:hypothetical protein BST96_00190 [Oceanicoccus sagamiensis]|uniref:Oxidoreductase n=1 Tax=Oceanicoccus sagamiensis TaxID=716816 RepID=A0A1X9NN96_9GAMM|nr:hypothetical protein BST96_00190 [Oceanicoccus sagamiensis]
MTINRRQLIKNTSTLIAASLLHQLGFSQTENPYRGSYDKTATGELVTEGIDLSGKLFAVTGCNSGLGFETMRVLSLRGAHVIGIARTLEKAEAACQLIAGKTTPLACELSNFQSVVDCSEAIKALNQPLDSLICNAGIMELPELEQVNGLEKHFVVNHLGHFILTLRLEETIKAAEQGRVVMLSSGRYKSAPEAGIEFDNLSGEKNYDPLTAYGQSKLANALFSQELSRRFAADNSNATSNAVLPGVIMTNLGRHMPAWKTTAAKLIGWTFMRSVEEGVATSCYVATHPKLVDTSGHMFINCNPFTPEGVHMTDRQLASQLWDVSVELTKDYL